MTTPFQPVISLGDLKLDAWSRGDLNQSEDVSFGQMLGLQGLGASYNIVPPGKSSCPYHNHHIEDEMFVILAGEGSYRFGETLHAVKAGDVLGAPAGGPDRAHQLINTGRVPLVYLGISTNCTTEVVEYPDSGKFLVSSRAGRDAGVNPLRFIGRTEASLDYWEGERGS
ncbi:MAG: cupin domain-containing protein [Bauldia sp.]|nr:cupin domain-containing protein [Bauldia sp.]